MRGFAAVQRRKETVGLGSIALAFFVVPRWRMGFLKFPIVAALFPMAPAKAIAKRREFLSGDRLRRLLQPLPV